MTTFRSNHDIHTSVVCGIVPQAKERLWIATADIKDMYVDTIAVERSEGRAKRGDSRGVSRVPSGRDMVPFLEVLDGMLKRGVELRLIHAKEPSRTGVMTSTAILISGGGWSRCCVRACIPSASSLTDIRRISVRPI